MSEQTLGLIRFISLYAFMAGLVYGLLGLTAGGFWLDNKKTERIIGLIGSAVAIVACILLFTFF